MFRRHTVKLYPNNFVKAKFELWERQCRWLWNLCLQQRLDAGWGMFSNMLEYKCREVIKINPAYTSQTCSKCGHIDRENRCGKYFECLKCGYLCDADTNAAHNILRAGLALRGECALAPSLKREVLKENETEPKNGHTKRSSELRSLQRMYRVFDSHLSQGCA